VAAAALEQSILESKDKDTLLEMAKALGVKVNARLKKGDIIDKILDTTGSGSSSTASRSTTAEDATSDHAGQANGISNGEAPSPAKAVSARRAVVNDSASTNDGAAGEGASTDQVEAVAGRTVAAESAATSVAVSDPVLIGADGEPLADWEIDLITHAADESPSTASARADGASAEARSDQAGSRPRTDGNRNNDANRNNNRNRNRNADGDRNVDVDGSGGGAQNRNRNTNDRNSNAAEGQNRNTAGGSGGGGGNSDEGESGNRRRRRRRKGRGGQEGPQGEDAELLESDDLVSQPMESVDVDGYLDIRDEGYGFLRVKGYLPTKDDAYIPLRLARQYGLRKGDHLTGKARPAGRNEKNPGLLEVYTVNGGDPELAKRRPNFEDLTALFPDSRLTLEDPSDPTNMTARIIDLVSPIGKGQRGIIVSPPKAGKTTVMKTIAKSIELNNPEVILIVLLIDERPEEVTDMRRSVAGEVISSTFDRPSDEHTHVAEMTIAKARRLVEAGKDVVIMLDGITRLSRAYNLAAPTSGKILSGGIDAGALYPPKKFFGAARNVEEGGSLTILATALVDTNSRMDEAIFEEFKGTGNMELRLDRKVAERRIYPAIDVDASSTRHEELLFDRKQLQQVWKLRRVLSGLAADGSAAAGLELLIDRLKTFRTNDEFLAEIAKQPSM
jgi:transcription termination factor Rho